MLLRTLSALLLALPLAAPAQTPPPAPPLPRLLAERRVLTSQYAAARAQRHALLGLTGKPSKQDLQDVVAALQQIVDKDEEIVSALNSTTVQAQATAATLQSTGRDDRNLTAQRLAELQNEQLNARQREQQATARQQALAADLAEARRGQYWRDAALAALAVLAAALLLGRRGRRR